VTFSLTAAFLEPIVFAFGAEFRSGHLNRCACLLYFHKGQTIAYANSFYDLYLAITTAEAILRETLFVSTATTARQTVGIRSSQGNSGR
jgi:hypothetical protein